MAHDESITPRGPYQECLEHSLVMAHILEHAMMFLPQDGELWHRGAVELGQYTGWMNRAIKAPTTSLEARLEAGRRRRAAEAEAA
jgi:hypothetical protein